MIYISFYFVDEGSLYNLIPDWQFNLFSTTSAQL